jgi:hypothetical protein
MKKTVQIIDTLVNKLVVEYQINLQSVGEDILNDDYFEEAWRCALEDNLVDPFNKSQYKFFI